MNDLQKALCFFEGIIYDNDMSFLGQFGNKDSWMITTLSFSSEKVHFVYVTHDGHHISDNIEWKDLFNWWEEEHD